MSRDAPSPIHSLALAAQLSRLRRWESEYPLYVSLCAEADARKRAENAAAAARARALG